MNYPGDFIDRIIWGHAIEVMREIPDNSVDLVFADPPFNVNKPYADDRSDYEEWVAKWVAEAFRVMKPTASFYHMTMVNHLIWKMPLMAQYGNCIDLIVWKNPSPYTRGAYVRYYQPIMLFVKSENYIFHDDVEKIHRTTFWPGKTAVGHWGKVSDIWDDIPYVSAGCLHHKEAILVDGTSKKAHPCQMPLGLARRAIVFSTDENAIVLDPFIGSGTTAVAAHKTGRHFIGIDVSSEYCELARERIEKEQRQLTMF